MPRTAGMSSSYTMRQLSSARPSTSSALQPNMASALPDQRITRRVGSHSITARGELSKWAETIVLARRSSSSTIFCSWMSFVMA